MKLQSLLWRGVAAAGILALSLGSLTSCVNRYETVRGMVRYQGNTMMTYSEEDTVLRDRSTGELWKVNREFPDGCLWENIGRTRHCYPYGGSK